MALTERGAAVVDRLLYLRQFTAAHRCLQQSTVLVYTGNGLEVSNPLKLKLAQRQAHLSQSIQPVFGGSPAPPSGHE